MLSGINNINMVSRCEIGTLDTTDGQFGKHRFLKPTNDYDPCAGIPISRLLSVFNCDLNVKVLVGALNQENALVWAFSMVDGYET